MGSNKNSDIKTSDLSNGLPTKKKAVQKRQEKDFFFLGKTAASMEAKAAALDARTQIVDLYDTLAKTQFRQMIQEFVLQASNKLTDVEAATYRMNSMLGSGMGGPPPLGVGDPMAMGGPPPLPVDPQGLPPGVGMGPEGGPPPLPVGADAGPPPPAPAGPGGGIPMFG